MARQVLDQLVSYGEIRRGRIGVAIQDLTPDLARALGTTRSEGALIARVVPGSPAARAGLKSSDLVVAVDGAPIHSAAELRNRVGLSRIGDSVTLTVDRGGSERNVSVRIEQARPARQRVGQR
jgi:S1-C subfamily serine protease